MIRIAGVSKRIGSREILSGIDLAIQNDEIFTVIGPSGSGKTTLLRLINLLDRPTGGSLTFDGAGTGGPEHERRTLRRRMAMVFQKPAMLRGTVTENVSAGLVFRKLPADDVRGRTADALARVGLDGFGARAASTLSGGEMQRVAIARAIVTAPELLLLDEPTANLDPVSTALIEALIVSLNRDLGTTIVVATHDMAQGQRLGHRMGVMMNGRILQHGTIEEIFYRPVNRAIASFVGIDPVRGGVIEKSEDGLATIAVGSARIQAVTPAPPGSPVALCIRPEDVTLTLPSVVCQGGSARNCLPAIITRILPAGPFTRLSLVSGGMPVTALLTRKSAEELGLHAGQQVIAQVKASAIHVIPDE